MPEPVCSSCRAQPASIEGYCTDCLFKIAERRRDLSPQDAKRLRSAVEAETAGLIPLGLLEETLEGIHDRLLEGNFDQALREGAIEILRLAGLGMCREMLKFTEALSGFAQEQEEEIRRKVKALSQLK